MTFYILPPSWAAGFSSFSFLAVVWLHLVWAEQQLISMAVCSSSVSLADAFFGATPAAVEVVWLLLSLQH